MVEFVLVSALAVILAMSLAQLGLFLWERNALLGSLSEGARVAAPKAAQWPTDSAWPPSCCRARPAGGSRTRS